MKNVTRLVSQPMLARRAVAQWRNELPGAREAVAKAAKEAGEAIAEGLEKQASEWISDNKLIHAGYARKLAAELRKRESREES